MKDKNKLLITLLPLIFAIVAIILFVLGMINTSNTILFSLGLIFLGLTYITSYITKKIIKENENKFRFIFGIITTILGIIILILELI